MRVILFGASGMVGQGVLRECLLAPDVEQVLALGRAFTGKSDPKLRERVHHDFSDFSPLAGELTGYDACFFCLGVSSAGMTEADYTRVTYDYTLAAARVLAEQNPGMTFIYVSGSGTDSTEKKRSVWSRVKGKTENALLALPLKAFMFRPGLIWPKHGIKSRTRWYRIAYIALLPFSPLLKLFGVGTTTENVGKAMLAVARHGADKKYLENRDIEAIVRS